MAWKTEPVHRTLARKLVKFTLYRCIIMRQVIFSDFQVAKQQTCALDRGFAGRAEEAVIQLLFSFKEILIDRPEGF